MTNLGFISLQSNDHADVFFVSPVNYVDEVQSDESLMAIEDPQFNSNAPWVTGYVPKMTPVDIDGDSGVLHGWFRGEAYSEPLVIRIYIQCELAEELLSVDPERSSIEAEPEIQLHEVNL